MSDALSHFVEIPDEQWTGTPKEMHKRADTIMRGFTSARHPQLGEVHFTGKGRSKTLFDKRTPHEFQSVQALPQIVEEGTLISSQPDRQNRPDSLHATVHAGSAGSVPALVADLRRAVRDVGSTRAERRDTTYGKST